MYADKGTEAVFVNKEIAEKVVKEGTANFKQLFALLAMVMLCLYLAQIAWMKVGAVILVI